LESALITKSPVDDRMGRGPAFDFRLRPGDFPNFIMSRPRVSV